jgi:hypothetical protein
MLKVLIPHTINIQHLNLSNLKMGVGEAHILKTIIE